MVRGAYAARVTSERLPVPARGISVVPASPSATALREQVDAMRSLAAPAPARVVRRFVFVWFRVFVHETRASGKTNRVNVRIPIPIPVVGALFPFGLSRKQALRALALADESEQPAEAVSDYLDSVMGFELVRVDERRSGGRQLVVVGFD